MTSRYGYNETSACSSGEVGWKHELAGSGVETGVQPVIPYRDNMPLMYCDCSMERVPASMSWWMHMPRTQDAVPRSEDLKRAPMESWRESSRRSLFPASSLSSTYTGIIMMMEQPCSKTKTEWSACVHRKPIQIRKAWSVAYHSHPACFSPYRPFLSLATFISFPFSSYPLG